MGGVWEHRIHTVRKALYTTTTDSMVQDDDEVCAPSGYTVTTGRIVQDDDDAVCAQSGYTVTTGSIVQDDDVHCAPG